MKGCVLCIKRMPYRPKNNEFRAVSDALQPTKLNKSIFGRQGINICYTLIFYNGKIFCPDFYLVSCMICTSIWIYYMPARLYNTHEGNATSICLFQNIMPHLKLYLLLLCAIWFRYKPANRVATMKNTRYSLLSAHCSPHARHLVPVTRNILSS